MATVGGAISAAELNQLRADYKYYEDLITFSPVYDPAISTVAAGGVIYGSSPIPQLRAAINGLESRMSSNCNCANCCQTCQTCQSCQSCQTCQTSSQCTQTCQSHAQCTIGNCDCNCDCDCTCFLFGSMILMSDFSWKRIEEVTAGEKVWGLNGVNTVLKADITKLGSRRSIWKFVKGGFRFSGEHPFWIKDNGREWFGIHDYTQYLFEKKHDEYIGVKDPVVLIDPVLFAHVNDTWQENFATIDHSYGPDTALFNLECDGSHTYIVNGYVVGGGLRDDDYDYSQVKWASPLTQWGGSGCL